VYGIVYEKRGRVIVFKNEKTFRDRGSGLIMKKIFELSTKGLS